MFSAAAGAGAARRSVTRPSAGLGPAERLGERLRLRLPEAQLGSALEAARAAGGRVLSVQPVRQSLEDFFFRELGTPGKEESWTVED